MELLQARENLIETIQAFLKEYDRIPPDEKCMALLLAEERFLKIKQAVEEEQNQPEIVRSHLLNLSEDIEYVSLEEVNDVEQEEKEFDLEDIFQIQDVILREKLLNVSRLIINIESLKDNPTPDRVLKFPSSFHIPITDSDSFFEKSDTSLFYSDKSLPEFEPFSDDTEETRSGSTTTHANHSLPEYDSFLFEIEPDQGELTNIVIEEVDTFLVPEDSIPPGIESNFDPGGGEIDVSQNIEDDDSFAFVIQTFLPYRTYPVDSPLLLSTGSEDTIFDPDIST
ncbi:hypothetical protein Tco_0721952 [Tanacetum coccineum]